MNLLLLLSALLSALTGVGSAVRGPQAAQVASRVETIVHAEARAVRIASRPPHIAPTLAALAAASALPVIRAAAVPLYASRRRE